jgi:hypothetical protein
VCESNSLSPKTRGRRVQAVVLSHGIQNPLRLAKHPAFCPTQACRRPQITAHHARLRHYVRPVLSILLPTHHSKPIAHESCSGSVQYIFSSPARLRSRSLFAYAFCRHAAELKMLCIERSRWRGRRFACNTPDVMHHDRATILIQFAPSYLLLYNRLKFHRS